MIFNRNVGEKKKMLTMNSYAVQTQNIRVKIDLSNLNRINHLEILNSHLFTQSFTVKQNYKIRFFHFIGRNDWRKTNAIKGKWKVFVIEQYRNKKDYYF